jgi:glycosyltransferase involved in cell wall biosynthesis
MSLPKITTIIATYNCVDSLEDAIRSVLRQNDANKELIVIDGGSTDGTVDLIRRYSDLIAHSVSEPDRGIYDAWNKGLEKATGDWICFLGADDFLVNSKVFRRLAEILQTAYPPYRVVYGKNIVLNSRREALYSCGEPWEKVKKKFGQIMCLPHPGLMHHRSLFEEHGKFNTAFEIAGDYEMLLRELRLGDALHVPLPVCAMAVGGLSATPGNMVWSLKEVRQAQRLHRIRRAGIQWHLAFARGRLREFLWDRIGENATRKILDFGRRVLGKPLFWTRT